MIFRRLLATTLLVPLLAGCVMKRDIRDVQDDIAELNASQQRLLRELQQQNEDILVALEAQDTRLRGDLLNQLVQIERQLVQIQELTGQGQQRLVELRQTLQQREQALQRAAVDTIARPQSAGDPEELFGAAAGALERGSMSTAQAGFEEFVRYFPQHPRAPAARLSLGAILAQNDDQQGALDQYSRILELHPNSPEAASALFRAALVERDRDNDELARSMFNQLTAAYPNSPEAGEARELLRRR